MMEAGADAVYCAASFQTAERMAAESIPVIGHVGLIPHFCKQSKAAKRSKSWLIGEASRDSGSEKAG
jgi:ketopantoate hydroxymethyltransferase